MSRHFEEMETEFPQDITEDQIEEILNEEIKNRRPRSSKHKRAPSSGMGVTVIGGRILHF